MSGPGKARSFGSQDAEIVEQGVASVVSQLGLEPLEVEFKGGTLRITLDSDPSPDLEAITDASRMISELLDGGLADRVSALSDGYELEVSSPGLERLLSRPDHFRRYVGSTISATLLLESKKSKLKGLLVEAGPDEIGVLVDGDKKLSRFSYDAVQTARTVFVWPSASKNPGSRREAGAIVDDLDDFDEVGGDDDQGMGD